MKKSLIICLVLICTACQQKEAPAETTKPEVVKKEITLQKACTKEAKVCPDGSSVGRNPNNNCEFNDCQVKGIVKSKKEKVMCTDDAKECPDGSFVGRDHSNNCKFKDCSSANNNM